MALNAVQQDPEYRAASIGSSEAAVACGVSEYAQPYDLWLKKTGRETEILDNDAIYWGNVLEDVVATEFAKRTDLKVRRSNTTQRHASLAWMTAHLDRKIEGEKALLECKTINGFSAKDLDEPKIDHLFQVHHAMLCTGYDRAYIAYLIYGMFAPRFQIFEVPLDRELADLIVDTEADFWRHVETDTAPAIDPEHGKASELIAKVYPGTNGETVYLPEGALHWHEVAREAKDRASEYESAAEIARNHLKLLMGEAAIAIIPGIEGQYTRKKIERKGYAVEPASYVDFRYSKKATK